MPQMPPGFWESKMRHEYVSMYLPVPFLDQTSTLLTVASWHWHDWSVARIKELRSIAANIQNRAENLRASALGWSDVWDSGTRASSILLDARFHRYRSREYLEFSPDPELVRPVVMAAVQLMFTLRSLISGLEATHPGKATAWDEWLCENIEALMESPLMDGATNISEDAMRDLGCDALVTECVALAQMQARIEDDYVRRNGKKRRKKTGVPMEEMRKLAEELDVPLEWIVDSFTTEYSGWWERSRAYDNLAKRYRHRFIEAAFLDDAAVSCLEASWDPGSTSGLGEIYCFGEEERAHCETIIRAFIATFISLMKQFSLTADGDIRQLPP